MAAPEVAKNPIPMASRTSTDRFIWITTLAEWSRDRLTATSVATVILGQCSYRVRRHDVEQHIAQHTSAHTRQRAHRGDSEQVEAFAHPDGRTRGREYRYADVIENYLKHACTLGARVRSDPYSADVVVEPKWPDDADLYCTTAATIHYGRGVAHASRGQLPQAHAEREAFAAAYDRHSRNPLSVQQHRP